MSRKTFSNAHLIEHPLIQHKLTIMRKAETSTQKFRGLLAEISMLLAYEVTRDMPMTETQIQTPVAPMHAPMLAGKKIVLVSILRAGQGIVDGMMRILPSARIGHIGLYREPKTRVVVEYYFKVPKDISERDVILVDPMLATGNSAVAAVHRIKQTQPKSIKFVSLLAAPEGIANMHNEHPDVQIYTAAIDERLDEHGYIVPGLGDAGDRLFGTK
jgi:uracil phosphoribosyltransferase